MLKLTSKADVYREAGWAVTSLLIGLPPESARPCPVKGQKALSESPSRPRLGLARQPWKLLSETDKLWFEARAVAILAGPLAETIAVGGRMAAEAAYRDASHLNALLLNLQVKDREAAKTVAQWALQAKAVLANPATWEAVERVAAALTDKGHLAGHEIGQLVRGGHGHE